MSSFSRSYWRNTLPQKEDAIREEIKDIQHVREQTGILRWWWRRFKNDGCIQCRGEQIHTKVEWLTTQTCWGMSPASPHCNYTLFTTWAQNAHVSLFQVLIGTKLVFVMCGWNLCSPSLPGIQILWGQPWWEQKQKKRAASCLWPMSARCPSTCPRLQSCLTLGALYFQRQTREPAQWLLQQRHLWHLRVAEARLRSVSAQLMFSREPSSHSSKSPCPYAAGQSFKNTYRQTYRQAYGMIREMGRQGTVIVEVHTGFF